MNEEAIGRSKRWVRDAMKKLFEEHEYWSVRQKSMAVQLFEADWVFAYNYMRDGELVSSK